MVDFSDFTESAIVKHLVAEATWSAISTVYVMVHSGDPGEAGTANTLANMGGRKLASFAAESGGAASTDADIEWTNGSGGSVTVSHVSLWDAAGTGDPPTGGNCLMKGDLTASKLVPDTEIFRIPSGSLTVTAT